MRERHNIPNGIWELCIGDEESGDAFLMKKLYYSVDLWVHNGFSHEGQGTVLRLHALHYPLCLHSRDTCTSHDHHMTIT